MSESRSRTPIAGLLERHQLRIVDIQRAAGVNWSTAQSWVRGQTYPTTEHVGRIAAYLATKGITPTLGDFVEVTA